MVRREENQIDSFKQVLQTLSDGEFHSGADLGKSLGLTRSAIWKLTQQFKSYGIEFESVTGKGYRIPGGFSLLDSQKIQAALNYATPASLSLTLSPSASSSSSPSSSLPYPEIEIWDTLASTNDYLMDKVSSKTSALDPSRDKNLCCLAERQTHGKGRQGKTWASPFGSNIYFSLLWHFNADLSELSGLSLVTAIALATVFNQWGIREDLGLKWPNDVLWKKQKLAGVLIEVSGETQHKSRAVIGIGINVRMPKESGKKINQNWTDMSQITGQKIDRNLLVAALLTELISNLERFQKDGFSVFMKDWQALDLCFNQKVSLIRTNEIIPGKGQGINEKGHFLLKDALNKIQAFSSGEISLKLDS